MFTVQLTHWAVWAGLLCAIALAGCAASDPVVPAQPCAIVPPEQTLVKKDLVIAARAELEASINAKASAGGEVNFKRQAEETYQRLGDSDVACSMLLRAVACLSERGAPAT